jgi:hypothetical protein
MQGTVCERENWRTRLRASRHDKNDAMRFGFRWRAIIRPSVMIVRFILMFVQRLCGFIMVMVVMFVVDIVMPMTVRMPGFFVAVKMCTARHEVARTAGASDQREQQDGEQSPTHDA